MTKLTLAEAKRIVLAENPDAYCKEVGYLDFRVYLSPRSLLSCTNANSLEKAWLSAAHRIQKENKND